jgi:hypothetical protein
LGFAGFFDFGEAVCPSGEDDQWRPVWRGFSAWAKSASSWVWSSLATVET